MQKYHLFKLHFKTPLHLSLGQNEVYESSHEILHSDTLKAAIYACGVQLYGKENMSKDFLEAFSISSAFPFKGQEYFFPKPMSKLSLTFESAQADKEAVAAKKIKKLGFIGKSFFEAILQGKEKMVKKNHIIQDGKFISELLSPTEKIMKAEIQERVNLRHLYENDTAQKDAKPFQLERIYWEEGAGLYFLLQTPNDDVKKKVKSILRLLGDNGIGTDRNVGNGMFEVEEISHFTLNVPVNAARQMNLSLYLPQRVELSVQLLDESAYLLKKRGGYVASPENPDHSSYRKRSIYMFSEGSVFPKANLVGKLADIMPSVMHNSHEIWRDGRALFVPMI